eukprot:9458323-Pyramimonas_sp.AAC.1
MLSSTKVLSAAARVERPLFSPSRAMKHWARNCTKSGFYKTGTNGQLHRAFSIPRRPRGSRNLPRRGQFYHGLGIWEAGTLGT